MPYITRTFMPRVRNDRLSDLPTGYHNLAFVSQFVEMKTTSCYGRILGSGRPNRGLCLARNKAADSVLPLNTNPHGLSFSHWSSLSSEAVAIALKPCSLPGSEIAACFPPLHRSPGNVPLEFRRSDLEIGSAEPNANRTAFPPEAPRSGGRRTRPSCRPLRKE